MIYIKDGKEVVAKTYFDCKQLEKKGYTIKKKKKKGRPKKVVVEDGTS